MDLVTDSHTGSKSWAYDSLLSTGHTEIIDSAAQLDKYLQSTNRPIDIDANQALVHTHKPGIGRLPGIRHGERASLDGILERETTGQTGMPAAADEQVHDHRIREQTVDGRSERLDQCRHRRRPARLPGLAG